MMSATTIILVLYFIQGSLGHALRQTPIVGIRGGHAVDIEHAPFMAALLDIDTDTNETYPRCGGSIVHEQFVLTTAHCVEYWNTYIVRVGSTRYDEGGKLHQVEKSIKHESYSYVWYLNNVALLKLSEPVTFGPKVAKIKLADASVNIPAGLAANVTGWGDTDTYKGVSRELQQASVTVSPLHDCNASGRNLTDKQVCVHKRATGACANDHGAPLTAGDLQIGIHSYGLACWGTTNVYEKVAPHLQWIRNKIEQNL